VKRDPCSTTSAGIWRVGEVLSSKDPLAEGRRMGHCVYSYARSIESGQTSIWSMTLENGLGSTGTWAMLTIEVRNELGRVVQARGRFNRLASTAEHQILMRWAGLNGLQVVL
jgi:PcfJ-like protein